MISTEKSTHDVKKKQKTMIIRIFVPCIYNFQWNEKFSKREFLEGFLEEGRQLEKIWYIICKITKKLQ